MVDVARCYEISPDHNFEEFEAEVHDVKSCVVRMGIT